MPALDLIDLATHLDRVRRRNAPARTDMVVRELNGPAGGWLSARPHVEAGEFASWSNNRILWLTARAKLTRADLDAAVAAARLIGGSCRRMYIWTVPWAVDAEGEAMLAAAGAEAIPHVQYLALVRAVAEMPPDRPTALATRIVAAEDAERVLRSMGVWYSEDGIQRAINLVRSGCEEAHVAFDESEPEPKAVALSLLSVDRGPVVGGGQVWGHLSSTGTDPEYRGRGAQTALIRSRVARAEHLGATMCSCETNTALSISLNNLQRRGFAAALAWRVFRWEDRAG